LTCLSHIVKFYKSNIGISHAQDPAPEDPVLKKKLRTTCPPPAAQEEGARILFQPQEIGRPRQQQQPEPGLSNFYIFPDSLPHPFSGLIDYLRQAKAGGEPGGSEGRDPRPSPGILLAG